jgi:hypothetical protein
MASKQKRSNVWLFFTLLEDINKVSCVLCKEKGEETTYTYSDKSTTNMNDHLFGRHLEEWAPIVLDFFC